jgi:integrase
MISLQRLTGMRPGEVVVMRTADIDRSGKVWTFTPAEHKMLYRGRERTIYLGPAAQEILKECLKADPDAFLFSPGEVREERFAQMQANRRTKVQPSQLDRRKPGAKRRPGARYTTHTYYFAIRQGCTKAFPHPTISKVKRKDRTAEQRSLLNEWDREHAWHPNQLRHTAATRLRKEFGLDVARVILGHSSPAVTEVYADLDREKALNIMGQNRLIRPNRHSFVSRVILYL